MADVFAPKLGSSIGYEAPVSQPQVGTALAGLSSTIFRSSGKTAAAPTSEEKFGAAWSKFTKRLQDQDVIDENTTFTAGTASLSQLRQFGSLYPQFSDDVFTRAKTENNTQLQQIEAQQSGQNAIITKYYSTGEAQVAEARAAQLRAEGLNEQADELEAVSYSDFVQRQAETNKIAENAKKTDDLTKVSNDAWSVNKKAIRSQVDIAANGLSEMLIAFKAAPTGSFDIDEMGLSDMFSAFPNLSITNVNKDNFGEFALQLKSEILRTQRLRIGNEVKFELRETPAGYEDEVFKGFDTIVSWAEQDLDPAEIVKRGKNDAYLRMRDSGIPVDELAAIEMITTNPDIQNTILSTFTDGVIEYLKKVPQGSAARMAAMQDLATDSMKDARTHFSRMLSIYSGNSTDAKPYPEVTMSVRQSKIRDNMLGLVESHSQIDTRTGKPQRFNTAAWDEYFAKNAQSIIQISAQDSDFATTLGTTMTNDIMLDIKKIQEVTQDKGVTISFNKKGQIEFGVDKEELVSLGMILSDEEAKELQKRVDNGDTLALQRLQDYPTESNLDERLYITQVVGPEGARKTTANLDDINYKWNILSQLGQVGSSVKATIDQEISGKELSEITPQEPLTANGPLSVKLGIDFGKLETEAGLPTGFLERTAMIESSGDPSAQNPESSAGGLFQQIDKNAKDYGVKDRFDPMQSTMGAVKFAQQNQRTLRSFLNREPTAAELYLAHQQGGRGAGSLLANPDESALSVLTRVYNGDVTKARNAIRLNKGDENMTAGEFADIWIGLFNKGVRSLTESPEVTTTPLPRRGPRSRQTSTFSQPVSLVPSDSPAPAPAVTTTTQAEAAAPVSSEEITPDAPVRQRQTEQGEARVGDQGMVRVVNSPVFDRDMQRFLQALKVDTDQAFVVADLDELEAAEAEGKLKKGDKVVVGKGAEAFVVEIE